MRVRNYDNVGNQIERDDSTSDLPRIALRMRLNYDLRGFLAAFVVLNRFSRKPSVHTSSIDKKHLVLGLERGSNRTGHRENSWIEVCHDASSCADYEEGAKLTKR